MSAPRPDAVPAPRWAPAAGAAAFLLVAALAWAVIAGAGPLLRVDRAVSAALYAGDDRSAGLEVLLQVATAVLLVAPVNALLKELIGRERPQFARGGAEYTSLAFPSGHAMGVAALVTTGLLLAWPALGRAARRWWLAAGIALCVLVGLTRLWLGVHWLSDVVGGEAFGAGWTLLVVSVFGRLAARRDPVAEPAGEGTR